MALHYWYYLINPHYERNPPGAPNVWVFVVLFIFCKAIREQYWRCTQKQNQKTKNKKANMVTHTHKNLGNTSVLLDYAFYLYCTDGRGAEPAARPGKYY